MFFLHCWALKKISLTLYFSLLLEIKLVAIDIASNMKVVFCLSTNARPSLELLPE